MSTTLHSFIDIFDTEISDGETSVKLNKIAIPLIQRDYAQGRMDNDVQRVRSRFLIHFIMPSPMSRSHWILFMGTLMKTER